MFGFSVISISLHGKSIDPTGITMTFTRALPKNLLEISQIVSNLWGKVSRKTLLSQVPFVDNVDDELKALDEETEENLKRRRKCLECREILRQIRQIRIRKRSRLKRKRIV